MSWVDQKGATKWQKSRTAGSRSSCSPTASRRAPSGSMEPGEADAPLSVYLRKEQVEALGLPIDEGAKILVVIYSKP